jgi:predicted Zn finger-like uncharacterized protein
MTFECSACHMRYRIDESILPPGGARVRCRQCSTMILISGPSVVPPRRDLDLNPPAQPARPRPAAPRAPSSAPLAPSNAPDWLASDPILEAPEPQPPAAAPMPPVFPDPPPVELSEPVGGMAVVGESPGFESMGVERFAPPTPPPPSERDPAFESIGMSVSRFEAGPERPPAQEPAPPAYPRLETESVASRIGTRPAASAPAPPAPARVTPTPPPAAPAAPRPAPPQAAFTPSAEGGAGVSNIVPLTHGSPIPEGLSPQDRVRHEKARRLARVLASDIAIYNREKKDRGMQEGNLVAVLGYEIKKSWETYKERVGAEFANSTPYFRDALNDMLAEGKKVF